MPIRLCAHLPDSIALVRILTEDRDYSLGRAPDCDLVVDHSSVSRQHARLTFVDGVWHLTNLGSKNGVRINGASVDSGLLHSGQWFSLGDVFCQFDAIDAVEIAAQESRAVRRRQNSRAWIERLQNSESLDKLLAGVITAMVELAECRRGFLLGGNSKSGMRVLACYRMDPTELGSERFLYSTGAVERALQERRPVFLSNPRDHAWLKGRASVFAQDLRVMACLPLIHDGRLLGAAYVDSDEDSKSFSGLDVDILAAFAEQAALAMVAADLNQAMAKFGSWLAVAQPDQNKDNGAPPSWEALTSGKPHK